MFICGGKAEKQDLPAIRKKLVCWRISKLPELLKLSTREFDAVVKKTSAFIYLPMSGYYYVFGTPATAEEIDQIYGCIGEHEHVIKLKFETV